MRYSSTFHFHCPLDRTTVIVAHRLSTIRNADKIIVMQNGEIVEEGDHNLLMQARGIYFSLVERQNLSVTSKEEGQKNRKKSIVTLGEENELETIDLSQSESTVIDLTVNPAIPKDDQQSATEKTVIQT